MTNLKVLDVQPMFTRRELARFLRVAPRTLDKLPIPKVTISARCVRYDPRDVQAYVDSQKAA